MSKVWRRIAVCFLVGLLAILPLTIAIVVWVTELFSPLSVLRSQMPLGRASPSILGLRLGVTFMGVFRVLYMKHR